MEDKIKYIFENTNNWLNFAEAKNAALLAFNVAVITAITSSELLTKSSETLVFAVSAILIISSIMSMISFIPKTNNSVSQKVYNLTIGIVDEIINRIFKESNNENLVFYGYISTFECSQTDEYLAKLKDSYFPNKDIEITKFEKDLAEEIIINSRITQRKYNYFKAAIYILVIGMILLLLSIIYA